MDSSFYKGAALVLSEGFGEYQLFLVPVNSQVTALSKTFGSLDSALIESGLVVYGEFGLEVCSAERVPFNPKIVKTGISYGFPQLRYEDQAVLDASVESAPIPPIPQGWEPVGLENHLYFMNRYAQMNAAIANNEWIEHYSPRENASFWEHPVFGKQKIEPSLYKVISLEDYFSQEWAVECHRQARKEFWLAALIPYLDIAIMEAVS